MLAENSKTAGGGRAKTSDFITKTAGGARAKASDLIIGEITLT